VLSERPVREADRIYSILTRDLGLVRATALGVRKENSKLRGSIEPISLSDVSLVRGKESWRLTSAEFIKKFTKSRPLALLENLVAGEAVHPELFEAVEKYLESDEITLVSRIMFHLGYLKESDLTLKKEALIKAINEGLQATML
jgi:DNA repair protein RecO